jgi:hypothetical protein
MRFCYRHHAMAGHFPTPYEAGYMPYFDHLGYIEPMCFQIVCNITLT